MNKITVIWGPTAAGKTQLALQMAQEMNAHIISADAYQVYQGLDIGTAKSALEIRNSVPHYLIDILSPTDTYCVSDFIHHTNMLIPQLSAQDIPIIICGGTALYIHAFVYGYSLQAPPSDPHVRNTLKKKLEHIGPLALWEQLNQIDPKSAQAIHPNNTHRVCRALEIFELTHSPASQLYQHPPSPRTDIRLIGVNRPRDQLYAAINQRVLDMVDTGLVQEVETLLNQGIPPSSPSLSAIGYPETMSYLSGDISLDEMIKLIQQHTRNFAKRQLTWVKKFEQLVWHNT